MTDELPPGWATARLESLVGRGGVMTDGDWVESRDQDPGGEVRLIQLADVGDGPFLDKSNHFMTQEKAEDLNCTFLQPRDVLISRLGEPLGKTCLFPGKEQPCVTVVDVHVVRPASTAISREWLVHLLNSPPIRRIVDAQSSGTTRKRITGQKLKDLEVRVAPAAEQRRIASKIDELFSRIDEGERALDRVSLLVERYRQSALKSAVTGELTRAWREKNKDTLESGEALLARILTARRGAWEKAELEKMKAKGITPANDTWKQKYEEPSPPDPAGLPELPEGWAWSSLDQLSSFVTSGSRGWAKYYSAAGDLFLRVGNMQRLAIRCDFEDKQFVTPPLSAEGLRTQTRLGDLVISITADVGMSAVIDADLVGSYVNQHLSLVRPVSTALSSWIAWTVASPIVQLRIRDLKQGATKDGLTLDDVRAIPVPLCSEHEIVEAISALERMSTHGINSAEGAFTAARAAAGLRQSVLKAAFGGRLVNQDPVDEPASALLDGIAAERVTDNAIPKRGRKKKITA